MNRLTLALLLFTSFAPLVLAQQTERDMKKEEAIWNELAAVAPKELDRFKAATVAMDNTK